MTRQTNNTFETLDLEDLQTLKVVMDYVWFEKLYFRDGFHGCDEFFDKPIMSFLEKHKVTNSAKKKS